LGGGICLARRDGRLAVTSGEPVEKVAMAGTAARASLIAPRVEPRIKASIDNFPHAHPGSGRGFLEPVAQPRIDKTKRASAGVPTKG
jgi:hypothetical protein